MPLRRSLIWLVLRLNLLAPVHIVVALLRGVRLTGPVVRNGRSATLDSRALHLLLRVSAGLLVAVRWVALCIWGVGVDGLAVTGCHVAGLGGRAARAATRHLVRLHHSDVDILWLGDAVLRRLLDWCSVVVSG